MSLGGLFVVELILISLWLDTEGLRGRGMLASLVHDWGAWTLKLGVALVLGSLIFAESRSKNDWQRIAAECAASRIRWTLLGAHAAFMIVFLWLSATLFRANDAGALSNSLVFAWALVGIVAFSLAAWAIIPLLVWKSLLRSTGDAWIYGLAAATGAVVLGKMAQGLWLPLSHWTFNLVAVMMRPFVREMVLEPSSMTIGTPSFHEYIAPQCSGYEGMALILAFSSAWLWFFRRQWRFPQALLLIPAGLIAIWISNAVRISALLLLGNAGWPQIAEGGFHSQAGWIAFNAVAIGICLLARKIPALTRPEYAAAADIPSTGAETVHATVNPTVPYLLPFLGILAASMVARSLSGDFEWFYGLRIVAALGALWYFRGVYKSGSIDWRCSWLGAAAGILVFAIWIALEPPGPGAAAPAALLAASSSTRILWIVLRIVGAVVMVPIAEELAFRGFLLRRLVSADFEAVSWQSFSWLPFLISSAAFGIMHGERWIAGIVAGAIFALVQIRRGRIGEAVLAHAVANVLVAAWVLSGHWQFW